MRMDPGLIKKLVCPLSRTALRFDVERNELVSDEAGLAYPVRNGVAVLLIEEARQLTEGERHG